MKTLIAAMTAGFIIFAAAGCGFLGRDDASLAQTPADAIDWGTVDESYIFDSSYAKTPDWFFAVIGKDTDEPDYESILTRVRLDDFTDRLEIPLRFPFVLNGQEYISPPGPSILISGITSKWIFITVDAQSDRAEEPPYTKLVLRISLDGAEQVCLGESRLAEARLTPNGRTLYFFNGKWIDGKKDNAVIEAFDLATGQMRVIFDGKDYFSKSWRYVWYRTVDGQTMLAGVVGPVEMRFWECVLIDAQDIASGIKMGESGIQFTTLWDREEPKNQAERLLDRQAGILTYCTVGEDVYDIEFTGGNWPDNKNLYRMDLDGGGKKLLREQTHIEELVSVKGYLLALAWYADEADNQRSRLHLLDVDGKPVSTITVMRDGADGAFGICAFCGEFMMAYYASEYGGAYFEALYSPVNGQLFQ